jgi:hypothetical protein
MRKKLSSLTLGTLGLAMAGSIFLGCQDFLGGDAKPTAAPSDTKVEQAAQPAGAQNNATDLPAQAVVTPLDTPVQTTPEAVPPPGPAAAEPAALPTSAALSPEQESCVALYNELQTSKDPRYGEVKDQYVGQNCDVVLGDKKPSSYVPLTLEERCKMYRKNLTETQSDDPKWRAYMDGLAVECAAYP